MPVKAQLRSHLHKALCVSFLEALQQPSRTHKGLPSCSRSHKLHPQVPNLCQTCANPLSTLFQPSFSTPLATVSLSVTAVQVPTVVLAYIPPGEESGEASPQGATKLQLQPFPGPLKYAYLAGWLTMAAQELK